MAVRQRAGPAGLDMQAAAGTRAGHLLIDGGVVKFLPIIHRRRGR
jgi:hypothetical protein